MSKFWNLVLVCGVLFFGQSVALAQVTQQQAQDAADMAANEKENASSEEDLVTEGAVMTLSDYQNAKDYYNNTYKPANGGMGNADVDMLLAQCDQGINDAAAWTAQGQDEENEGDTWLTLCAAALILQDWGSAFDEGTSAAAYYDGANSCYMEAVADLMVADDQAKQAMNLMMNGGGMGGMCGM